MPDEGLVKHRAKWSRIFPPEEKKLRHLIANYYGMISLSGVMGFPVTQMNCKIQGDHWGVLLCPKSRFLKSFPCKFQLSFKKWTGPWGLPVAMPTALVAALWTLAPG